MHQGLGKRLLRLLIDECTRLGRKQMLAVIGDSTNAASVQLHQSLGFRKVPRAPPSFPFRGTGNQRHVKLQAGVLEQVGFKFGEWKDVLFMQRALDSAASLLTMPSS